MGGQVKSPGQMVKPFTPFDKLLKWDGTTLRNRLIPGDAADYVVCGGADSDVVVAGGGGVVFDSAVDVYTAGDDVVTDVLGILAAESVTAHGLQRFAGAAGEIVVPGLYAGDASIEGPKGPAGVQEHPASLSWLDFARLADGGADTSALVKELERLIRTSELSPAVAEIFNAHLRLLKTSQAASLARALARDAIALHYLMEAQEAAGAKMRRHTFSHFAAVIHAIRGEADRALLRSPTQTGKSRLVGLLWKAVRHYFPGKSAVVIVPSRDILTQHKNLLEVTAPDLRVGLLDQDHKNLDIDNFDIVVAVIPSLIKHRSSFPPGRVGMVIIDEAMYSLAKTWQGVLKYYGFLDANGKIQHVDGRFLLGLTSDPYSISQVFGGGPTIISPPIKWFEDEGYLHRLRGLTWQYPKGTAFDRVAPEVEGDETGWDFVPKNVSVLADGALKVYQDYGRDEKAIVYTMRVREAVATAAAFNRRYGTGYAVALHNEMPQKEVDEVVRRFNDGSGPHVLCLVGKCSQGTTLQGVSTIIHANPGMSMRRYGQRVGRPLGVGIGEKQRTILNVDMLPSMDNQSRFVTLLRYRGISDIVPAGMEYDPRRLAEGGGRKKGVKRKSLFVPKAGMRFGTTFRPLDPSEDMPTSWGELSGLLDKAMAQKFEGDISSMADALGIDFDLLDRYLNGALPQNAEEVKNLAEKIGGDPKKWMSAWESDALAAVDFLYPIPKEAGEFQRELILLARRVTLYLGGLNPVQHALNKIGFGDITHYHLWLEVYNGRFGNIGQKHTFKRVYDILTAPLLVNAGVAHPAMVGLLLEDVQEEMRQKTEPVNERLVFVGSAEDVEAAAAAVAGGYPSEDVEDKGGLPPDADTAGLVQAFAQALGGTLLYGWPLFYEINEVLGKVFDDIEEALRKLTTRQEEVLRMRFFEDLLFREIGEVLGISGSRAGQIEEKALKKLRWLMHRMGYKVVIW